MTDIHGSSSTAPLDQPEVERLQLVSLQQISPDSMEPWKVPRRDIRILGEIGTGAWGAVAQGTF